MTVSPSPKFVLARWLVVWLIFVSSGLATLLSQAIADERPLTDYVGADVGICVELRNLKSHWPRVVKSEWVRRLGKLSFIQKWQQSAEYSKLQASKIGLEVLAGQPLEQLGLELFGNSVLLAITPGADGKPTTVLLSRAATDEAWDKVLKLWDQLEAHEVQTSSAFGHSIQRRQKKKNGKPAGPDVFTARTGRVLAISEQEAAVRNVLSRVEPSNPSTTLTQSLLYQQAASAVNDSCVIQVFVNARAWDAEVQKGTAEPWLKSLWNRWQWLAVGLDVSDGIIWHSTLRYSTENLADDWQQLISASQPHNGWAENIPDDSFVAGELRLNLGLIKHLKQLDTSERAQRDWTVLTNVSKGLLGRDLFDEVLPALGPSLGMAIVPSRELTSQEAPVDGLFSLSWPLKEQDLTRNSSSLRDAIDGALLTLWNFGGVSHNSRVLENPLILKTERDRGLLRWLEGNLPYQPAYGFSADRLLLATDPRLIRDLQARSNKPPAPENSLFWQTRRRYFADHGHWLFIHTQAAHQFLKEEHDPLTRQLAYWRKMNEERAGQYLTRLEETLSPFDGVFLAGKLTPGEIRVTSGFVVAPPDR